MNVLNYYCSDIHLKIYTYPTFNNANLGHCHKDSRMVWNVHCEEFSHAELLSLSRAPEGIWKEYPNAFPKKL